jgi:hypothetical protein
MSCDFPIDLVYTWVDGSDAQHRVNRAKFMKNDASDAGKVYRFRCSSEIYESIRSALTFAPWIRQIFVVMADGQDKIFQNVFGDQVKIVLHSDLYTAWNPTYVNHLPTFNSHSIESHLGHIPELTEHFLYANDDTFFGTPVEPSLFFDPATGKPRVCYSKTIMARPTLKNGVTVQESWKWARHNNSRLLDMLLLNPRMRQLPTRYELIHQIRPMRKSFYEEAWKHPLISTYLQRTSASRFRQPSDIEPVGFLLHWKTQEGQTQIGRVRSHTYFITDRTNFRQMFESLSQGKFDLYCLNDGMTSPYSVRLKEYQSGLHQALPHQFYLNHLQQQNLYQFKMAEIQETQGEQENVENEEGPIPSVMYQPPSQILFSHQYRVPRKLPPVRDQVASMGRIMK